MATNKERIDKLEEGLGGVQDNLQRMEMGIADKFQHLEENLVKLSDAFLASREPSSHNFYGRESTSKGSRESSETSRPFSSKIVKLEFPIFFGDELSEWLNCVDQFFEF